VDWRTIKQAKNARYLKSKIYQGGSSGSPMAA
jgi:hypothetical protein